MKALSKNFGKLNQLVGEKFANASKHDMAEELKQLELQTEARKEGSDQILDALESYLKTVEKKKEGVDKQKHSSIELLGQAMSQHGSDLTDESLYGQSLIKVGQVEESLGAVQLVYAEKARGHLLRSLEEYHAEMKNYKHLKTKLESRRLDYDAKLNKIQKSKKEKPELDDEMRAAQQKYEETLAETEQLMISLNDREDTQLEALLSFINAQHEYHVKAAEMLGKLMTTVSDSSVRASRVKPAHKAFSSSSAPSQQNSRTASPSPARVISGTSDSTGATVPASSFLAPSVMPSRQPSNNDSVYQIATPAVYTRESSVMPVVMPSAIQRPKLVRANYSFMAENTNELSINKGDVVTVVNEVDDGWWMGDLNGTRGLFPSNYCEQVKNEERIESPPPAYSVPPENNTVMPRVPSVGQLSNSMSQSRESIAGPAKPPRKPGPAIPSREALNVPSTSTSRSMSRSNSNTNLLYPNAAPVVAVGPCSACGCNSWTESMFKKDQCNNCFHTHS